MKENCQRHQFHKSEGSLQKQAKLNIKKGKTIQQLFPKKKEKKFAMIMKL